MTYKELKQLTMQLEGMASKLDLVTVNNDNNLSPLQKTILSKQIDSTITNLKFSKDSINS